jgi:tRNA pseudouridine55 synthase
MDGILIINKPKGRTSHDIVAKVKKIVGNKVGHTGTLDPNATGVLPLLIGKGTLCSQYLMEHDKIYEVVLKLGIQKDTADSEGNVIREKVVEASSLNETNVIEVLRSFLGKQEQTPPIYSAIKVNGKKLYEYARRGQIVEIKPRQIEIYKCELKKINIEDKEICFVVHCSKGTYIRSLCEDIAERLDTIGYMKELNRIKVGKFDIKQSITVEELEENITNDNFISEHFISIEKAFSEVEAIIVTENRLKHLKNGVKLSFDLKENLYRIYNEKKDFIGIGSVKNNLLKREIILD